jgi:hypothetical protein
VTRALSFRTSSWDDGFQATLDPTGSSGSGWFGWMQEDAGSDNWAKADFQLFDVTVTDLTAPVPLPATLPLLGAGIAFLGWLGRRARA